MKEPSDREDYDFVPNSAAEGGCRGGQWDSWRSVVRRRDPPETQCSTEESPARGHASPGNTLALGVERSEEKASHILQSLRGF